MSCLLVISSLNPRLFLSFYLYNDYQLNVSLFIVLLFFSYLNTHWSRNGLFLLWFHVLCSFLCSPIFEILVIYTMHFLLLLSLSTNFVVELSPFIFSLRNISYYSLDVVCCFICVSLWVLHDDKDSTLMRSVQIFWWICELEIGVIAFRVQVIFISANESHFQVCWHCMK